MDYKLKSGKFIKNGHTMFEQDVLTDLKRLAYLEEERTKQLILSGVSQQRELLEAYTKQIKEDNELTEEITFQDINKCIASNFG
tara:strand:+ start:823 stop:1074 length:252 start_codon:yes stop_codon:yes gene_type:complete